MTHIKPLLTIAIVSLASFAMAQTESVEQIYERYDIITEAEEPDTAAIRVLIEDWEKDSPNDADLFYLRFFYQSSKIIQEGRNLSVSPQKMGDYMGLQFVKDFQPGAFDSAFEILDEGIAKYPNRLDLRLNRVYTLFISHENDRALETLLQTISYSKQIKENWLVRHDLPLENRFEEFELYMNEEIGSFWNSDDFANAMTYVESFIAAYPQTFMFRTNHAAIHAAMGNTDQAIEEFLLLEKENPKEGFCIISLAQLYADSGNEDKAREYCDKAIAIGEQYAPRTEDIMRRFETVKVDFDEIKEYMKDHEADYRDIEKRFIEGDPRMSLRDLSIVYFGHALTPECNSTQLWDINADSLLRNEKYEELLKVCEETLEKHPASLAANLFASMCSEHLDNPNGELYYLRCSQIGRMIYEGAGRLFDLGGTDDSDSKEKEGDADSDTNESNPRIYKILWRADENAFVDYMLRDEDKKEGLYFTEPVYFIEKDF